MPVRPVWSGSISFGLVTIPVKLVSAVQSEELDLDLLSKKEMAPVRYARIDTATGKELPWKDIVKGYQYAKGKYVVVTDEDFAKASPEKSKNIDIVQFVKDGEIDPVYFEKPYYVLPGKGAEKSYKLLLQAMETTGSVGVAEFMLRNRNHLCALKVHGKVLLLNQMRYHAEVREVPEEAVPQKEAVTEKEVELAVRLVEQLTETFNPAAFKDTYLTELKKVIRAKAAGKNIRIAAPKKETATVRDLMDVLKESLSASRKRA